GLSAGSPAAPPAGRSAARATARRGRRPSASRDEPTLRQRALRPLVALLVVCAVAFVGAAVVAVVAFLSANPHAEQGSGDAGSAPTPVPPPLRLQLTDQGTAVVLSWNDPSGGTVSFVVAYGHADRAADNTQRVPPGTTSITINGLNTAVDYCFTVAG